MPDNSLIIDESSFTLKTLNDFLKYRPEILISNHVRQNVEKGHTVIQEIIKSNKVVYGVNTGFGKFADVRIPRAHTKELQKRLVLSHAAGVGEPFSDDIVRLILLLKLKNLSHGYSGVRFSVLEHIAAILNSDIIPIIPQKGSVGASGDLAPLAHMALTMIGEGETFVFEKGVRKKIASKTALAKIGLRPLELIEKEGLAILNGTQAMQACGCLALLRAKNLVKSADIIGSISLEGLLGTLTAFDPRIHAIRNHPGQTHVAFNFNKILENSPIVASHKESNHRVQDAYCLRCIPQVHGAIRDGLEYIESVFVREINGVTDNPLIFSETNDVLSGGNFHGEPLALTADYLAILMAELANISERRIEHMMDPTISEMAGFLTSEGGLNSGFMIAQVTAAALVSENKVLAHPASVDSIPTSANKEDHVSMGTHAARKALEIVQNCEYVLAIELISACQAIELRAPVLPSKATATVLKLVREKIAHWDEDRLMQTDIENACLFIQNESIVISVEKVIGRLN